MKSGFLPLALCLILVALAGAAPPTKEATNSLGMKFVLIPAGEFLMGATEEEIAADKNRDEKRADRKEGKRAANHLDDQLELAASQGPKHKVSITKPFYLGMHEVTQENFKKIMGFNPSGFAAGGIKAEVVKGDTKRHPVERVSWEDAAEFCRQLSAMPDEVAAGRAYRLPTEAEWEYSCRAGTTTPWYFGNNPVEQRAKQEYLPLAEGGAKSSLPVGSLAPNPWGLFDMSGNVSEWCADWYDAKTYSSGAAQDPVGPSAGVERVVRGGTAIWRPADMRSFFRRKSPPESTGLFRGFRVACDVRGGAAPAVPVEPVAKPLPTQEDALSKFKSLGLVKQGFFFVIPEEADLVRYVSALERLRIKCFTARSERDDAENQLNNVGSAKVAALQSRIDARNYTTYSSTWREHWDGVRARHNAHDTLLMIDLSKEDIQRWKQDAESDLASAISVFGEQCQSLRVKYDQMQAKLAALASNSEVKQALAEMNKDGKAIYRLGPAPATATAGKKLENEETLRDQLQKTQPRRTSR